MVKGCLFKSQFKSQEDWNMVCCILNLDSDNESIYIMRSEEEEQLEYDRHID